jgi:FMN phosphatase YigB (HAD superfamily)
MVNFSRRIINKLGRVFFTKSKATVLSELEHNVLAEVNEDIRTAYVSAIASGLFNTEWYEARYGKFEHPILAFQDYVEKSKYSNANPSSAFDTEYYHRCNIDIYHADQSPLLHYIFHGKQEGRRAAPEQIKWHPKKAIVAVDDPAWQNQKIAICLHIFYPDFVEKFADCLRHFPCQIDVFVSVSHADIQSQVEQTFSEIPQVKFLKTAVAPNRGRNFGPMLVEFGKDLLNYDLMCHLHSKKSLYSGREQTQWFDYLNQYLFKDRHVVACLLRLFQNQPQLGMYYPTSFWMMPAWVNHWTCNKPFAQGFEHDWGIECKENFINYPVGGMFWARPAAIKQLLESDFDYEDFPAEPLPNDGSWLHALERSVGLLAEKNGYEQFFYYPPTGQFTKDKSYIFAPYVKTSEVLFNDLRNHHIVSFDVFDTVVRRQYCQPEYAKFKLGKILSDAGLFGSAESFVKMRNDLEFQLRQLKNFQGDVSISEVYAEMAKVLDADQEQVNSWMHMEFDLDLEQIVEKDEMVQLIHRLHEIGREIWFVTDIYYTRQQVEAVLKKAGLIMPHHLYVSSELGKRKDTGTMWQYIAELVKESGKSFVHVGDNVRSDAQLCGDYGLTNVHILHPLEKWQASGFAAVLTKDKCLDESHTLKWGALVSNLGRYPLLGD